MQWPTRFSLFFLVLFLQGFSALGQQFWSDRDSAMAMTNGFVGCLKQSGYFSSEQMDDLDLIIDTTAMQLDKMGNRVSEHKLKALTMGMAGSMAETVVSSPYGVSPALMNSIDSCLTGSMLQGNLLLLLLPKPHQQATATSYAGSAGVGNVVSGYTSTTSTSSASSSSQANANSYQAPAQEPQEGFGGADLGQERGWVLEAGGSRRIWCGWRWAGAGAGAGLVPGAGEPVGYGRGETGAGRSLTRGCVSGAGGAGGEIGGGYGSGLGRGRGRAAAGAGGAPETWSRGFWTGAGLEAVQFWSWWTGDMGVAMRRSGADAGGQELAPEPG
ncbi:hypothetical protein HNY73_006585 [Argiope bruennichi]|uniref:Spidroin N-terminal domain-containing protein n=1 Tax=Argiope bruennichi TaxID=94029 RepID=A0A8T0FBL9_ARGBR|nr:hypothetical protein HNY73_006585 [Argiope bruennichi]